MTVAPETGFVPPPYPYERLEALRRRALLAPGGLVDCSIGTPCDPLPAVVAEAVAGALDAAVGYPTADGSPALRAAAADWVARTFGVIVEPEHLAACVGTKEFVASLPHLLRLRDPARDTVLYPAVSYPTYAMGARLAGCRAVPVPLDGDWHLDLDAVGEDAGRALCLWVNEPGNPTASAADRERLAATVAWARARGVVVASDECYAAFAPTPTTALAAGSEGVLAVHSVSKRSNAAGLRVGFYAGDPDLVAYLRACRRHAGLMAPGPAQAGAAAALRDEAHVEVQRARYAQRRDLVLEGMAPLGLVHDGGPTPFYLWMRAADGADGWEIAARLAETTGMLVAPGDLYGAAGADHVRIALVQPAERLARALRRGTDG